MPPKFFEQVELNETGKVIFENAIQHAGMEMQKSFQYVLNGLADLVRLFPFDINKFEKEELEKEYWTRFLTIKDNIFPTKKGEEEVYTFRLDISSISDWIERLKPCTESWGLFTLLLYGKYIQLYETRI